MKPMNLLPWRQMQAATAQRHFFNALAITLVTVVGSVMLADLVLQQQLSLQQQHYLLLQQHLNHYRIPLHNLTTIRSTLARLLTLARSICDACK